VTAPDAFATATDVELLGAARAGTADSWGALVRRYSPKMYAVARSFGLDSRTAEDLVQTAWLRLLERHDQAREVASLGPWLAMVVRNDARKLVTRRRTVPVADGFEHRPADSHAPDAGLLTAERAAALRSAFARLGDDCRQLLRLVTADPPMSYDEIAAAVGRPRGALGPTRARCLENLRRALPPGFEP
jgi:RNA polymerase sigma factor (sigma-70 family)